MPPDNFSRFLMLYVGLTSSFNTALLLLSESRLDAYVSLNVLSFYVSYSITRPFTRLGAVVKLVHAALLTTFSVIVGLRIYEVLMR